MKVFAKSRQKLSFEIMIWNDAEHIVDTPCVVCFAKFAIFIVVEQIEVEHIYCTAMCATRFNATASGYIPADSPFSQLQFDTNNVP